MHSILNDILVLGVFRSLYNGLDSQVWVTPWGQEEHAVTLGAAGFVGPVGSTHRGVALSISLGLLPQTSLTHHSAASPTFLTPPSSPFMAQEHVFPRFSAQGQGDPQRTSRSNTVQTHSPDLHSLPGSQAPHRPQWGEER